MPLSCSAPVRSCASSSRRPSCTSTSHPARTPSSPIARGWRPATSRSRTPRATTRRASSRWRRSRRTSPRTSAVWQGRATMEELSPALAALYEGRRDEAERLATQPDVLEAAALGRNDELRAQLERDPLAIGDRTPEGFTPMHLAAFFGGAGAIKVLLAAGASADADGDNDRSVRPIHSAAAARDNAAVRALLEAGADPN